MTIKDFFHSHLKIKESYELPDALLASLLDDKKKKELFDSFLQSGLVADEKTFTTYFQEEHSDRKNLMQDYTPDSIIKLVGRLAGENDTVADICSGTGGLSLNLSTNHLYCEEISGRAIPILLFSLAIKNRKATVVHGDSLNDTHEKVYELTPSESYSDIEVKADYDKEKKFDLVVSNPPYSLKWDLEFLRLDERFLGYPLPPKSKADYAFLLHGLHKLKDGGRMLFIYPHGVLFRGSGEGELRKYLLQSNLIDTIIGLPGKMFQNTAIPTVLMIIERGREKKDVLVIDASQTCEEQNKFNIFTDEHLEKIATVAKHRLATEKFSSLVELDEIERNEFNLNIPRYVDITDPEPVPDLIETLEALLEIKKEEKQTEKEFYEMFFDLVGTTPEEEKVMARARELAKELMEA